MSDCLYCLEIKNIDPYYLTLYLASRYGQIQLKGFAKGSCSKYITKEDLLKLKIAVPPVDIQLLFRKKYLSILFQGGRTDRRELLEELVSEVEENLGKE